MFEGQLHELFVSTDFTLEKEEEETTIQLCTNNKKEKLIEYLNSLRVLYNQGDINLIQVGDIIDKISQLSINDFDKASFIFSILASSTKDKKQYLSDTMNAYSYQYYKTAYDISLLELFFKSYIQEIGYILNNKFKRISLVSYVRRLYHRVNAAIMYKIYDNINIDSVDYNLLTFLTNELINIDNLSNKEIIEIMLLVTNNSFKNTYT